MRNNVTDALSHPDPTVIMQVYPWCDVALDTRCSPTRWECTRSVCLERILLVEGTGWCWLPLRANRASTFGIWPLSSPCIPSNRCHFCLRALLLGLASIPVKKISRNSLPIGTDSSNVCRISTESTNFRRNFVDSVPNRLMFGESVPNFGQNFA